MPQATHLPTVGFVGVGQMGRPMVERLVLAGFAVSAFVRREQVADEVVAIGAAATMDLYEVLALSGILIVCTFEDAQVREAFCLGRGGHPVLRNLQSGAVLVNHVTGSPRLAEDLAAAVREDVAVLDAPVSGTADDIRAGRLTVLAAGGAIALERARPALSAYADPIVHVGTELGDGQRIKLINNLLFTANLRLALAAASLGEQLGLSPTDLATAIGACSGKSYATDLLCALDARHLVDDVRPYLSKDVTMVREVAAGLGLDLGLLGQLAAWVERGDIDESAVNGPTP